MWGWKREARAWVPLCPLTVVDAMLDAGSAVRGQEDCVGLQEHLQGSHRGNSGTRWQRWPGSRGKACSGSAKAGGQPAVSVPGQSLSKREA